MPAAEGVSVVHANTHADSHADFHADFHKHTRLHRHTDTNCHVAIRYGYGHVTGCLHAVCYSHGSRERIGYALVHGGCALVHGGDAARACAHIPD